MHEADAPNRIREFREKAGLSQTQLAAEIGREASTLWRYENGRGAIPDEMKKAMAVRLDVSIQELMGWEAVAA